MGKKELTTVKSKRLTVEESKRLVWTTVLEFWIVGFIVYFFTNPSSIALLLACPIALHALVNFWEKSDWVPVTLNSVIPPVFMAMAFMAGFGALLTGLFEERILNSQTLSLATMCVLSIMVIPPESRYTDYV